MVLSLSAARRPHGSIRLLLIALVCVPLVAVGVSSGISVASGIRQANQAAQTSATVRLVAQVDAARNATEDEALPALLASVEGSPSVARAFGLSPAVLALVKTIIPPSTLPNAKLAVQRALAAVDLQDAPPALVSAVKAVERQQRLVVADGKAGSAKVLDDYIHQTSLVIALGTAEQAEAQSLLTGPVGSGEFQSFRQLSAVVGVVSPAGLEAPFFIGYGVQSYLTHSGLLVRNFRPQFLEAWTAYEGASAEAASVLRGPLAVAWRHVVGDSVVSGFDQAVNPLAAGGSPTLLALASVVNDSFGRDAAFSGLLRAATAQALAASVHHQHRISDSLLLALLWTLALVIVSIGVAVLASRAISKPVRRLAQAARQISQGNLVEVEPSGPAEVRTAGEALRFTAASLRQVEAQAADVAAGRLDSALLQEPAPGPLGAVVHASVGRMIETIHEREALQSELVHQAAHDPLTALPNRAAALNQIEGALARSARSGQMLGLLFVDLDGFKAVNDGHGHAFGDQVLRRVSERMRNEVRTGDVVCRLGGDEFVVVVEDAESEVAVLHTANRLIDAVREPLRIGESEVRIGASIGVAISSDGGGTADALLGEADAAVYRAKAAGRGQAELFDQHLRDSLHRRTELERAMRLALRRNEFALHYQPVVDVVTGLIRGYEALLRWHRPDHGVVMPDEFIPVAEQSTIINDIGRWVLFEATAQLRRWTDERGDDGVLPSVAVNVSGRQLATPQLVDDVTEALAASGIAPAQLTLELTETVLVSDPSCVDRLLALKAIGVRVALDDFGTGYTSIGQLGHFPLDVLKIDRSFISAMATSDQLVQMMIQMAHTFSLAVVAEGVEDASQLHALRDLRCDAAQGYLFARPRPADQLDSASTTYDVAPLATA